MEIQEAIWISKGLKDKGFDVSAYDIAMLSDTYYLYLEAMREINQTEIYPNSLKPSYWDSEPGEK